MKSSSVVPEPSPDLFQRAFLVRRSSIHLAQSSDIQRQSALLAMADALATRSREIVQANVEDINRSLATGLNQSLISRLKLDEQKLECAIEGVRKLAYLSDPLGRRLLPRDQSGVS